MKSKIILVNSVTSDPDGLKIVNSGLITPNVPLLHNFANAATYPSQAATIPINTTFTNISSNTETPSAAFQTKNSTMQYDAANQCIKFLQPNTASWAELTGGPSPWANQATDFLFTFIIRPYKYTTSGVAALVYSLGAYGGGNNNLNAHLILSHDQVDNEIFLFVMGTQMNNSDMFWTDAAWNRISVYASPQGVNGAGFIQVYKDGALLKQVVTTKTTFSADGATVGTLKPQFGGEAFDLSYLRVMKGLFAQGLNPADYA